MSKIPQNDDNNEDATNQRTFQLVSTAVIISKCITFPIKIELIPNQGRSNLNMTQAHRNIFFCNEAE